MSDNIKLIIEIPKPMYENVQNGTYCGTLYKELKNGTPLDNNSERAEVQAYFAGQTYGWDQGRKALIGDLKAEIESLSTEKIARCRKVYIFASEFKIKVLGILDSIGGESEGE